MITETCGDSYLMQRDARSVACMGVARAGELYSDLDTTRVNHDWLVSTTRRILAGGPIQRFPMQELERMIFARHAARGQLFRVVTRRGPTLGNFVGRRYANPFDNGIRSAAVVGTSAGQLRADSSQWHG